jgi:hypothetical protein
LIGSGVGLNFRMDAWITDFLRNIPAYIFLLHDVGQFVSDQALSGFRFRLVLLWRKHNLIAKGVGVSVHRTGRQPGFRVVMYPNMTEIAAKPRLKK